MKAIIFDFDGTLANTLPICYAAFQQVFKQFDDRNLSEEEIRSMFGPSETGIIKGNLVNEEKDEAIQLYYQIYTEQHVDYVRKNAEIDEMLQYLRDNDLQLGVVTGKARRSLDISLKALRMESYFDTVITGDDVINSKPHPEGVIKALSLLNVENDEATFIGDSDADIQAGKDANVYTIGAQWLPAYQTARFTTTPDSFFESVSQMIDFINNQQP